MNKEQLTLELQAIARTTFRKPELILDESLTMADVDTWTSLSFTQFIATVEERFGFKFKMVELFQFRNMGAVIEATLKHIA